MGTKRDSPRDTSAWPSGWRREEEGEAGVVDFQVNLRFRASTYLWCRLVSGKGCCPNCLTWGL